MFGDAKTYKDKYYAIFNEDISTWDVSKVTDTSEMFLGAQYFNRDISKWDVSSVTDMHSMFKGAKQFNVDISKWDVSHVTDMKKMFLKASAFRITLCGAAWVRSKVSQDALTWTESPAAICTTTSMAITTATSMAITTATTLTITTATTTTITTATTINATATAPEPSIVVPVVSVTVVIVTLAVVVVVLVLCKTRYAVAHKKSNAQLLLPQMSAHIGQTDTTNGTEEATPPPNDETVLSTHSSESVLDDYGGDSSTTTRTFATSNYKRLYDKARPAPSQYVLFDAVTKVFVLYAKRKNPTLDDVKIEQHVKGFMGKMRANVFEYENNVAAVAEYLWTSAIDHDVVGRMEFSSVLNAVIRDDIALEIEAAAPIVRSINSRRIKRLTMGAIDPTYPPNGETWRGTAFRNEHKAFFDNTKGKKYRVPAFLATSSERHVAATFAFKASKHGPCALWHIQFDKRGREQPQYRVRHMAFVSKTLIPGEEEYLFAPYSVFELVSIVWSGDNDRPHEFIIHPAVDNKKENEHLPLAPWY